MSCRISIVESTQVVSITKRLNEVKKVYEKFTGLGFSETAILAPQIHTSNGIGSILNRKTGKSKSVSSDTSKGVNDSTEESGIESRELKNTSTGQSTTFQKNIKKIPFNLW